MCVPQRESSIATIRRSSNYWSRIGSWAARFSDLNLRDLPCRRIEVDEMWSFVYAKEKNVGQALKAPPSAGDVWLWVAFCPDTKLVPSWRIGDRISGNGHGVYEGSSFTACGPNVQLTSDGHRAYLEAVEEAFAWERRSHAMLAKMYAA